MLSSKSLILLLSMTGIIINTMALFDTQKYKNKFNRNSGIDSIVINTTCKIISIILFFFIGLIIC